ncbi:hypothetical protein FUAX_54840 (plasmid) [Fulvitalea axinellae]|uniref:NlpE C-terminal OB domain-containing protein n=1 Tax=Fulvitalea axinellae TaxID=1182444 RepID=A0AAU9D1P6_9BACT|nr:hypothetical protein FUAX_54840 [Fulvitalea axinellae]
MKTLKQTLILGVMALIMLGCDSDNDIAKPEFETGFYGLATYGAGDCFHSMPPPKIETAPYDGVLYFFPAVAYKEAIKDISPVDAYQTIKNVLSQAVATQVKKGEYAVALEAGEYIVLYVDEHLDEHGWNHDRITVESGKVTRNDFKFIRCLTS